MDRRGREEDYTEGLGGISIPSAEDIVVQFVQGNPNASLEDIASLIQSTGADLGKVANTFGIPMAEAQRAFDTAISSPQFSGLSAGPTRAEVMQAQAGGNRTITNPATGQTMQVLANDPRLSGLSDQALIDTVFQTNIPEDMKKQKLVQNTESSASNEPAEQITGLDKVANFIAEGNKTDEQIYREMVKNDVPIEQIAERISYPIDEATTRFTRAQEMAQIEDIVAGGLEQAKIDFPNGIPDNLLRRYATETNQPIEQIATNMDSFGVSVDDMARATGIPLAEVQAAYNRAKGGAITGGTGNTVAGNEVAGGTGAGVSSGTGSVASSTAVGGRAGAGGQTGLAGSERALAGGVTAAAQAIESGAGQARADILGGTQIARQDLTQGAQEAGGLIQSGTGLGLEALGTGLGAARRDIMGGAQAGLGALYQGLGGARTDLQAAQQAANQQYGQGLGDVTAARDLASQQVGQAFGQAGQMFDPYRQAGTAALQQQAALSGALGQEAFNQAFQASPQQQFLREQGERAALRTAAARGGLSGGNVMKELSRFNTGLASQDLQNQIANLQQLGSQGLGASGSAAQYTAQGGAAQADLQTQAAQQLAAQRAQIAQSQLGTGQQLAGLGTLAGQQGLSTLTGAGQQLGNLGVTGGTLGMQTLTGAGSQLADIASGRSLAQSQLASQAGRQLGDVSLTGGMTVGDYLYGTGGALSANRMQAGRDIAGNITNQINALAQYQGDQGTLMSDLIGQQANILAGIQGGAGTGMSNMIGGTAGQLAGVATGTGTAYNPTGVGGTSQVTGIIPSMGEAVGAGIAAAGLASDVRLKENIKRVGTTPSGHGWYNWDWNKIGLSIVKDQPSYGVLAQEVSEKDPSAVIIGDDGYFRVDYSKV